MEKHGVAPDLILTSPLLRAVQTADILAESLVYNGPLIAEEALGPGFDLANIKPLLEQYRHINELVIVGHEPDLGGIVSELLNLPQGFTFKKGSGVRLNIKPTDVCGSAVFKWLASGRKLITSRKEACG
jgi:phosphohistidine phosphatase